MDELNESLLVEQAPVKAGQLLSEPLELPSQLGHPLLQVPAVEVAALVILISFTFCSQVSASTVRSFTFLR